MVDPTVSARNTPRQRGDEGEANVGRASARSRRQSNASTPWWSASSAAAPVNKFDVEIQQFFIPSRPSSAAKQKKTPKGMNRLVSVLLKSRRRFKFRPHAEAPPPAKAKEEEEEQFHSAPSSPAAEKEVSKEAIQSEAQPSASLGLKRATREKKPTEPVKEMMIEEDKVKEDVDDEDESEEELSTILPFDSKRGIKPTTATKSKASKQILENTNEGLNDSSDDPPAFQLNSRPRRSAADMTRKRLKGGAGPVDLFARPVSIPRPEEPKTQAKIPSINKTKTTPVSKKTRSLLPANKTIAAASNKIKSPASNKIKSPASNKIKSPASNKIPPSPLKEMEDAALTLKAISASKVTHPNSLPDDLTYSYAHEALYCSNETHPL